jgi:diguanylate cyclase (GGDEF)-like protein
MDATASTSLLLSYSVQAAGAFFTAVLFGFLSRTYRKQYLLHWARGFAALCIMLFGAGLTIALVGQSTPLMPARLIVSTVTSLAAYVNVVWLLAGAGELLSARWAQQWSSKRVWTFMLAVVLGTLVLLPHAGDPDPFGQRFVWRIGIRSVVIGLAFLLATVAVVVARDERQGRPLGRGLVGVSFALYGLLQLHLGWLSFSDRAFIAGSSYSLFTGFVDFVLVFAMGLGVVIWLLEEEHTKTRDTTEKIAQLAYHDPLTGLPNRKLLLDHLTFAIPAARREQSQLAIYFIDLDRFKVINDSLGHSVGDKLLQVIAGRVKRVVRENDTVARMGGDEFVVLTQSIDGINNAVHIAQKIRDTIREPVQIEGRELFVSGSMGISIFPNDGDTAEALLKNADTAMYRAKAQGNDLFQMYTPEMNAHAVEQLALESALRRAVEAKEFELHYQPIVRTVDNKISAVEAMLRWRHPVLGLVRPEQFLRLAEATGLIVPIGEWTLRAACRALAEWRSSGYPELRVAINMSARQLKQPDVVDHVRSALGETSLPGDALEFEITEMQATQSEVAIIDRLRTLRQMGVRISIDDFGTGFSSVSVLRVFPVDALKIDTSFVRDLVLDPNDAVIAGAVIALAKSMGLEVIAEGVENPAQLEYLKAHGCQMWQGYLCCPPVRSDDVRGVLGRRSGAMIQRLSTPVDVEAVKH